MHLLGLGIAGLTEGEFFQGNKGFICSQINLMLRKLKILFQRSTNVTDGEMICKDRHHSPLPRYQLLSQYQMITQLSILSCKPSSSSSLRASECLISMEIVMSKIGTKV